MRKTQRILGFLLGIFAGVYLCYVVLSWLYLTEIYSAVLRARAGLNLNLVDIWKFTENRLTPVTSTPEPHRRNITYVTLPLSQLYAELAWVRPGGLWTPPFVKNPYRVAIIAPYRERQYMLTSFLYYMHTFMQRQNVSYRIYISEQLDPADVFNRATAFNVGYREARKDGFWDCIFFHDIDLIPEDFRNVYRCRDYPVHFSYFTNKYTQYEGGPFFLYFGGVIALTDQQFHSANGFSNHFWGWGGEDDDMRHRVKFARYDFIYRKNITAGRYTMLKHPFISPHNKVGEHRYFGNARHALSWYRSDGLTSLNYTLHRRQAEPLYTWILASYHKEDMERTQRHLQAEIEKREPNSRQNLTGMASYILIEP